MSARWQLPDPRLFLRSAVHLSVAFSDPVVAHDLLRALDHAHEAEPDNAPPALFDTASHYFSEHSLESSTLRYMAGSVWGQMERRS
jgi:hypothetical protein